MPSSAVPPLGRGHSHGASGREGERKREGEKERGKERERERETERGDMEEGMIYGANMFC